MIDAKALKIGNTVFTKLGGGEWRPCNVDLTDLEFIELPDQKVYKPIPLTEEWLQKFNLPKRDEIGPEYSIRNDFEIYCYFDNYGNCLFYGEISTEIKEFFIIKCNSVHTFQNIYAVLNPHEKLTIKS